MATSYLILWNGPDGMKCYILGTNDEWTMFIEYYGLSNGGMTLAVQDQGHSLLMMGYYSL